MLSTAFFPEFFNPDMAGKVSRATIRWKSFRRNGNTHFDQELMRNKAGRFRATEIMTIRRLGVYKKVNEAYFIFLWLPRPKYHLNLKGTEKAAFWICISLPQKGLLSSG